ncbi:hypothetical protein [Qipengyuania qiaonensis]|uniref:DUF4282 domain-containing protein n=1 Tax=Qipengyuania qiaonensis TaxID=2867240 RepID=A0ABS7J2C0_9SPHN|nr:hypothetical protein [Qipengyuania qiaonensis]MBX7481478.1 hypothetical protein [Qipengyuania qiaonensis]
MRISDYLAGIPMVFHSPLPQDIVTSRINSASKSVLNPFALSVTGYVRFGKVMLEHRSFPYYNAQPRLSARLIQNGAGTTIEGRFGAATWHKVFFVFWYVFLTFLTIVWISIYLGNSDTGEFFGRFGFFLLLFWVAPFAFHFMFTMGWKADMERIAQFLEKEVDAQMALAQPI